MEDERREHIMELEKNIHKKIKQYCKIGDAMVEKQKYDEAIDYYIKAKELLPEPIYVWEASSWIFTAIGEVYFIVENYYNAIVFFGEAEKSLGGKSNPFILLRIGQCYYELNELKKAEKYLYCAYSMQGEKIFEGEKLVYLDVIKNSSKRMTLNDSIEYLRKQSVVEFKNQNYKNSLMYLESAWDLLPDEKISDKRSFLLVSYILEIAVKTKDKKLMKKWVEIIKKANPMHPDCGDREMWIGKVEYELENYENSIKYFEIANRKSKGRCFCKDSIYYEFYCNYKKL